MAWGCWFCSLSQPRNHHLISGFRPFLAAHLARLLLQTSAGLLSASRGFWQGPKIKKEMPLTLPWDHHLPLNLHSSFTPFSFSLQYWAKFLKDLHVLCLKITSVLVAGHIWKYSLNIGSWIAFENLALCCFHYWQACLSLLRMPQRLKHTLSFMPPSLIWLNKKDCAW